MELFEHGGITPGIRRAFVVYLAGHNRPFHEVLFPTRKDIRLDFEQSFVGMTTDPVELDQFLQVRERLLRELPESLDREERAFLRGLARAEPDWAVLRMPHLQELPGIRWKLQNLERLARDNPRKLRALADALDERLGLPR